MADYTTECYFVMNVPRSQRKADVLELCAQAMRDYATNTGGSDDEDDADLKYEWISPRSLCIRDNDGRFDAYCATKVVRGLLDAWKVDKPVVFAWSCTCSRACEDAYGGGAAVVRRGYKDYMIDALAHAQEVARTGAGMTRKED